VPKLLAGRVEPRDQLLFVVFVNGDGFEILGFEDLAAIQTFDIIHAVTSRDDHGAGVLTGLHKTDMGSILMMAMLLSRGILVYLALG
jgi:hypothetical protein